MTIPNMVTMGSLVLLFDDKWRFCGVGTPSGAVSLCAHYQKMVDQWKKGK